MPFHQYHGSVLVLFCALLCLTLSRPGCAVDRSAGRPRVASLHLGSSLSHEMPSSRLERPSLGIRWVRRRSWRQAPVSARLNNDLRRGLTVRGERGGGGGRLVGPRFRIHRAWVQKGKVSRLIPAHLPTQPKLEGGGGLRTIRYDTPYRPIPPPHCVNLVLWKGSGDCTACRPRRGAERHSSKICKLRPGMRRETCPRGRTLFDWGGGGRDGRGQASLRPESPSLVDGEDGRRLSNLNV